MSEPARRTLVTGAGGFVGANLVRRLVAGGHAVIAAVRPGGNRWRLPEAGAGLEVVELDLTDAGAVECVVADGRPEWAFHLAAHGAYSWQTDARAIFETNVMGAVHLLEACRAAGCEALVNAGSSSEYGLKDHPADEQEALAPNSEYAAAKAGATLLFGQAHAGPMRVTTLRLYSIYGPWEDPGRLIATLAARGLRGELPPLADPDVARDFVEVEDALDAFLAAVRPGASPAPVLNVGSGRQTTVREAVEVARRRLGIEAEPEWGTMGRRRWDTNTWVARTERAERELGWRAPTTLEEGFGRMVDWLRATPAVWPVYGVAPPG